MHHKGEFAELTLLDITALDPSGIQEFKKISQYQWIVDPPV